MQTEDNIKVREFTPLVSICCITYNHVNYIKDAIEGFLIQKTTFPVEIIIHDDASTDGTVDIIKFYVDKNPNLILPIFQTENQYSKRQGSIFARFIRPRARGKYIAICEGDDYWTDPYKLQKQVDFLEANEEFGLAHGDCNFYFEEGGKWKYNANENLTNKNIITNKEELFYQLVNDSYKIRTATVVFKRKLLEEIKPNSITFLMGDTPLWLDFSQLAKFKYFDEVFSVYRVIGESASRSKNLIKQNRFNLSMGEMRVYYSKKYGYPINQKLKTRYNRALIIYKLLDKDYKELYPLIEPSACQRLKYKAVLNRYLKKLFFLRNSISNFLSRLN